MGNGKGKKRKISIGVWIAGVVVFLGVACFVIFIMFDPFGLLARFLGTGDPIAAVIPADTPFYFSLNLLELESEETTNIVNAFREAAWEEDLEEAKTLTDYIDEGLEEYNLSFNEDIEPWVGQYVAFSVLNLEFDDIDYPESIDMLFIVEARNKQGADEFIRKLIANIVEAGGDQFEETEYKGVLLYEQPDDEDYHQESFAIARYKNLVFFSNDSKNIIASIDLESSETLAKDEDYRAIRKQFPRKQLMNFYIDFNRFLEVYSPMSESFGMISPGDSISYMEKMKMAMSISTEDIGIRLETIALSQYDYEEMSDTMRERLTSQEIQQLEPETDAMFPEETLFFYAINRTGYGTGYFNEIMAEDESGYMEDFTEALELFELEFDIDFLEFFKALDGEFAIGLAPSSDGLFQELTYGGGERSFALQFLFGTSQEDVVLEVFQAIDDIVVQIDPSISCQEYSIGDMTLFDLGRDDRITDITFLTYGVGDGYAVISTSPGLVEDTFDGGLSLTDNSLYQQTWQVFPKGDIPVFYIDVQGFFRLIQEMAGNYGEDIKEDVMGLEPVTIVAGTNHKISENMTRNTIIIFIETGGEVSE